MYLDGFRASLALDIAAPVILAVAAMLDLDRFRAVATPTTHRPAAARTSRLLVTNPILGADRTQRGVRQTIVRRDGAVDKVIVLDRLAGQ